MDPSKVFCHNPDCPARGKTGCGNSGVVSKYRDGNLITHLIRQVYCCALYRPLLFCVDGLSAYVSSVKKVFRVPVFTGRRGRPRLRRWEHVCVVQVIKQVSMKRVVGVVRRMACGTYEQAESLLKRTQNTMQAHVAYIERLNGTFRSRIVALVHRGRCLARQLPVIEHAMYLVGSVYNFCAPQKSLRLTLFLSDNRIHWVPRTPAIAAGITDHIWTVHELLSYKVPLPPWKPTKQRGRPSKRIKKLIKQWCYNDHT